MNPADLSEFTRRAFLKTTAYATVATTVTNSVMATSVLTAVRGLAAGPEPGRRGGLNDEAQFLAAVRAGDRNTVAQWLDAQPGLAQCKNSANQSAFAIALLNGNREIGRLLVNCGYKPDLHEAALAGDWELFKKLSEQVGEGIEDKVNQWHPVGGTAMHAAALGGAGFQIWRVYAQCGDPNPIARSANALTPLELAIEHPDLELAELTAANLLSNDAIPDPAGSDNPPLHRAVARGSVSLTEMLVRLGAQVDRRNKAGQTPIQLARALAQGPDQKLILNMLSQSDAVPRICRTSRAAKTRSGDAYREPDWTGITQLEKQKSVGLAHSQFEQLKQSVVAEPRLVHSQATTGERAIEAAAHMGQRVLADWLLDQGAPYSLPTAVMMGDQVAVKQMLNEDPDRIHERGAHDFALLWYPVIGGCDLDMTELLLQAGANVEQQHFLGTTALHWASRSGNLELIELLLDHGADVNRVGRKFAGRLQSPIQMARDDKTRQLLRQYGAR